MAGRGTAGLESSGWMALGPSGPLAAEGLRGETDGGGPPTLEGEEERGKPRAGEEGWGPGAGSRELTSTSQRALELVAEVADWRSVVRRNTCSLPLYSSHVRNFSCSAWNSRTTSPCRRWGVGSGWTRTLPGEEPTCLRCWRSSF